MKIIDQILCHRALYPIVPGGRESPRSAYRTASAGRTTIDAQRNSKGPPRTQELRGCLVQKSSSLCLHPELIDLSQVAKYGKALFSGNETSNSGIGLHLIEFWPKESHGTPQTTQDVAKTIVYSPQTKNKDPLLTTTVIKLIEHGEGEQMPA